MWDKVVEKVIDVKAKANLQLLSKTREIISKCPRSYKLWTKNDKNDANWEYWDWDKDKDKAESHNPSSVNSQPQTQASKKDKCHGSLEGDHLIAGFNTTKIAKKNKDKVKDLSHIKN